jgi:hypothetical protein
VARMIGFSSLRDPDVTLVRQEIAFVTFSARGGSFVSHARGRAGERSPSGSNRFKTLTLEDFQHHLAVVAL